MAAWFGYSKKRLLGVLMVLSLAAAVLGQRAGSYLRQAAHVLISPLGDGGMYVVTSLKSSAGRPSPDLSSADVRRLLEENERFRQQVAEYERLLAVEQQDRRRELEDVQRLRRAFDPTDDLPCEFILARVAAADSLPYGQGRVLNRGASSGVAAGAPVLARLLLTDRSKEMPPNLAVVTTSALVGRIESAGPFTARLLLLSDPSFTIRARILRRIDPARTRWVKVLTKGAAADEPLTEQNNAPVPVLAAGDGAGGLVADATTYANILPGDRLVTADDDPYLRREVPIGVVEEVVVRPENHQQVVVRVRPFENLAALRDVYILYWKPL